MTYFQIIRELQRHLRISEERSLFAEKKMASKIFTVIGILFSAVYFAFLAIAIGSVANSVVNSSSDDIYISTSGMFMAFLPMFLLVDYGIRLSMSSTPMQFIRPYTTMPVPRYAVVDCSLINTMTQALNFMWLSLSVPFCMLAIMFRYGMGGALLFILMVQLIFILNSLLYVLIRSYASRNIFFWILPVIIYALPLLPLLLCFDSASKGFDLFFYVHSVMGDWLVNGNIIAWIIFLSVIIAMIFINRRVQYAASYKDTSEVTDTKALKNVSSLGMFDRFGLIGEYIKIDIKSVMRNKAVKKQFYMIIAVTIMFSLINSFSETYADAGMFNYGFWTNYSYILVVLMMAMGIMTQEGNYIECLMVRKESIYDLIRAKYFMMLIVMLLPFCLMIPMVVTGKITLLFLIAMYFFTAGPIAFGMMHMVYFNNYSISLNATLTKSGSGAGGEVKTISSVIAIAALLIPSLIMSGLGMIMSETSANIFITIVGVLFVITNSLWIKNIYRLFMKRRYKNMDGFRETRM